MPLWMGLCLLIATQDGRQETVYPDLSLENLASSGMDSSLGRGVGVPGENEKLRIGHNISRIHSGYIHSSSSLDETPGLQGLPPAV